MQRFLLYLIFNLHIAFTFNLVGQVLPSFVRIDPPSFVNVNSSFTTSLIFKVDVLTTDDILIKFNKPKEVGINTAVLKSWVGDVKIPITTNPDNKNEITLELNADQFALDAETPYQILLECYIPKPVTLNKDEFYWKKDMEKSSSFPEISEEKKIEELQIYDVQKTAGSSIKLVENSELEFKITNSEEKNIYFEFWMKSENLEKDILTVQKELNDEVLLSFSENDYGFIAFPILENEIVRDDVFLGSGIWNYIGINLRNDISGMTGSVYINSRLAFSTKLENIFDLENLIFDFNVSEPEGYVEIDRLKIWEFGNNLSLADKNKHFLNFEADSSSIIYQSSFDNNSEFNSEYEDQRLSYNGKNISYAQSTAPIFSKAPKLTVNIGSAYNSIVWYVQEFSVAKEFEIEKAVSGSDYQAVFSTLADDDPLRIYYYTDEIVNESDVAFYRVKQINIDGSVVYSPEVKIGNREIEEFKLSQNYPNPFNPITSIYVEVIIPSEFKINVYDLVGNTVSALYEGYLSEGLHTFEFDGSNLPSGIYFYEVISPSAQSVKKMILAK